MGRASLLHQGKGRHLSKNNWAPLTSNALQLAVGRRHFVMEVLKIIEHNNYYLLC